MPTSYMQQHLHSFAHDDPALIFRIRDSINITVSRVLEDAFSLVVGERIAGHARIVTVCPIIPSCVVKIALNETDRASNRNEWEIWESVKDTSLARWCAPCRHISPSGALLIMERTTPIPGQEASMFAIPCVFQDVKLENWGYLGGVPVCHDYESVAAKPGEPDFGRLCAEEHKPWDDPDKRWL